ncbi:MAG: hypothetical protein HETSPECPRED_008116 [Heterodermia speciosa]|uniref:MYND-type domain-containing protein n=1 Tax=Heterodermia speciosa TaxID=116794 RepID=A0A8H3I9V9_9LECA|nr:MAG: hypothetical protein HETSPECPRED_008116 [Heterodermia speciosa]
MSAESPSCGACHKQGSDTLKHCSRCKNEAYCSTECQTQHWPTHKAHCKRPNYILKFHLCPGTITDPPIWRTLSCPADATFQALHKALQIAFGYASIHTYDFRIKDMEAERQLEEEDSDITNYIMRMSNAIGDVEQQYVGARSFLRIVDPDTMKYIDRMHMGSRRHKETPEKMANRLKLHQVLDDPSYRDAPLQYEYDFGDCWEHQMTHMSRADNATDCFQCTDGEGHGVAEDVGSTDGWKNLKRAYRNQRPNKEQREKMKWFESFTTNMDPKGLGNGRDKVWPKVEINSRLEKMVGK